MKGQIRFGRDYLTGPTTLTVSTAGNDANGSLTFPFATIAGAYNWARRNIDIGAGNLLISVQTNMLNMASELSGELVGANGYASCVIDLNGNAIGSNIAGTFALSATLGAQVTIQNGTVEPANESFGLVADGGAWIAYRDLIFNANGGHALCDVALGKIIVEGPWTIAAEGSSVFGGSLSGSVDLALIGEDQATLSVQGDLTLSGIPTWNSAFIQTDLMSYADCTGFTYSGSAVGKRGNASQLSALFSGGVSAEKLPTFFPGTLPVTVDPSSIYD